MAEWQIHRDGDLAAVYADGSLFDAGNIDVMKSLVLAELGVTRVANDAFLLGQKAKSGIATSLAQITTWQAAEVVRKARIAEIRAERAALKAEAIALGDGSV